MLCAKAPQVPVVSTKSGNVYEKRLIEAYISENGTEPTTGEALTLEDLIDLKTQKTVRPRPPTLTSIPSLLGVFQEEWDALALETYNLRQNLAQTRQELSNALYQSDAAVRVIARLTKERDEAREALANVDVGPTSRTNGDAMHVDPSALPQDIIAKIAATQDNLTKTRRKRPVPDDWATADAISSYTPRSTSKPLRPGGTVFSVHGAGDFALVGGTDSVVDIYSVSQNKAEQSLKADGGAITGALWVGDRVAISTAKGSVLIFSPLSDGEVGAFNAHDGSVTAIALHPSGDLLASVGKDRTYVLYDLQAMKALTQVPCSSSSTCAEFHPDGHLLAVGAADGNVRIFEVSSGTLAANIELGNPLQRVKFSENGIFIACVTQQSSAVSIWDIRKIVKGEMARLEMGGQIEAVDWDYTGQFIAAGGPHGVTVSQYSKASKGWSELLKSPTPASSVAWGKSAQSLLVASTDGIVTVLAQ